MNDNTQHGIDDNPNNDAEKGAALGGVGGAVTGAIAGSLAGPVGTIVGALAGGLIGAGASGAAVAAIDQVDNDNTVSGVGGGTSGDLNRSGTADVGGHNIVTGEPAQSGAGASGLATGAVVGGLVGTAVGGPVGAVVGGTLGSLAGGVTGDAAEAAGTDTTSFSGSDFTPNTDSLRTDTSNMGTLRTDVTTPAVVSGDLSATNTPTTYSGPDNNYSGSSFQAGAVMNPGVTPADPTRVNDDVLRPSDQTDYRSVDSGMTSIGSTDQNADMSMLGGLGTPGVRIGNDVPGVQTGGVTTSGADTRGIMEKTADALTGDNKDDKTGGAVPNDRANLGTDPMDTTTMGMGNDVTGGKSSI